MGGDDGAVDEVSGLLEPVASTIREPNMRQADATDYQDQLLGSNSEHSLGSLTLANDAKMLANFCVQAREQVRPSRARNASTQGLTDSRGNSVVRLEQHKIQIFGYLTSKVMDDSGAWIGAMAQEFVMRVIHAGFDRYFEPTVGGEVALTDKDMENMKVGITTLRKAEEAEEQQRRKKAREGMCVRRCLVYYVIFLRFHAGVIWDNGGR